MNDDAKPADCKPEIIGGYTVHPVASLFPLMDDEAFDGLKDSIRFHGQQVPIIVQGKTLLDGRNRLRACLALKIQPLTVEYTGRLVPGEYIFQLNFERRDLTETERLDIAFAADPLIKAEAKERQLEGQTKGGQSSRRGQPKNSFATDSSQSYPPLTIQLPTPPTPPPPPKPARAPDTRTRLAEKAGVSQHKAQQYLNVREHAPELLDDVKRGNMKMPDAAKVAAARKAKKQARSPRQRKPPVWKFERAIARATKYLKAELDKCPLIDLDRFKQELREELK